VVKATREDSTAMVNVFMMRCGSWITRVGCVGGGLEWLLVYCIALLCFLRMWNDERYEKAFLYSRRYITAS
jgi:hypothetical protein